MGALIPAKARCACGVAHCSRNRRRAHETNPMHRRFATGLAFLVVLTLGAETAKGLDLHLPVEGSPPTTAPAPPAAAAEWSTVARRDIPGNYQQLYAKAAGTCPDLTSYLLAGIGRVESNHGKSTAPGVRSGLNAAGCCAGPMQFNLTNGSPSTWDAFSEPGQSPYKPEHAIPAAARKLCANGLRPSSDNRTWKGVVDADPCPDLPGTPAVKRALRRYNNACWYVADVLGHATAYAPEGKGVV